MQLIISDHHRKTIQMDGNMKHKLFLLSVHSEKKTDPLFPDIVHSLWCLVVKKMLMPVASFTIKTFYLKRKREIKKPESFRALFALNPLNPGKKTP